MTTNKDEIAWIKGARTGNRDAFERLVTAHASQLRRVVRRMIGHPEDTEEVTQEALLRAWKGIGALRSHSGFGNLALRD